MEKPSSYKVIIYSSKMFEIISKAWNIHSERIEEVRQRESKYIGAIKSCWCPYKCACPVSKVPSGDSFHHFFDTLCEGGEDYEEGKSTKTCILMLPGEDCSTEDWSFSA